MTALDVEVTDPRSLPDLGWPSLSIWGNGQVTSCFLKPTPSQTSPLAPVKFLELSFLERFPNVLTSFVHSQYR